MKQKYFPRKKSFHFLLLHLDVTLIASRSMTRARSIVRCVFFFRSFSFLLQHVSATGEIAVRGISIMLACSDRSRRIDGKNNKRDFSPVVRVVVVFHFDNNGLK